MTHDTLIPDGALVGN